MVLSEGFQNENSATRRRLSSTRRLRNTFIFDGSAFALGVSSCNVVFSFIFDELVNIRKYILCRYDGRLTLK